jgi:hypothetical protein
VRAPTATALPPGVTEDDLSTLVGITSKPRELCLTILAMTKNLEVACQLILEGVTPDQLRNMAQAQAMGGGNPDMGDDDYGDESLDAMAQQIMGGQPGGAGPQGGMPAMPQGGQVSQQQAAQIFQQFA